MPGGGGYVKGHLARSGLFGGLEGRLLDAVVKHCVERQFHGGDTLWRAGQPATHFDMIESGLVKVGHLTPSGDHVTFGLFGTGDIIGIGSAIAGTPYPANATAVSEHVQVIRVRAAAVLTLLDQNAQFAQAINRLLVQHTAVLRAKIDIVAAGSVPKRLAALLLYLVGRFGSVQVDGVGHIPIVLTRQQISELVDARIETVIRILSRWQKADWLRTVSNGFELRRADMLARIAKA